jgi:hypothetical protein
LKTAMTFYYLGFDQIGTRRVYAFDCRRTGERPLRVVLSADLSLFTAHSVNMQDGPAICIRKLAAVEDRHSERAELTSEDFRLHAAEQSLAADQRTAAKRRPRQRPPARRPRSLHSGHWG